MKSKESSAPPDDLESRRKSKRTALIAKDDIRHGHVLAPFHHANTTDLALLAVLLRKKSTEDAADYLPKAAGLWAKAYTYHQPLKQLFLGKEPIEHPVDSNPPALSLAMLMLGWI
jgi:hypothetical protein